MRRPIPPAKDPVNILGFTAANILNGSMPVVYAEELEDRLQDALLLDVAHRCGGARRRYKRGDADPGG